MEKIHTSFWRMVDSGVREKGMRLEEEDVGNFNFF